VKKVDQQAVVEPDVEELPRRLCSEIQLFDLCELTNCSFKDGRYCTHADLLVRFEALAEPDDRPAQRYDDEEDDEELASYPDERDEDDDDYSVFDDEDELDGRHEDEW
jgi:hypothetical protein